jgi:hypothetical protein
VSHTARVAPAFDCSESLGRVKTALRRCAVLTRPARSQYNSFYRSDVNPNDARPDRPTGVHLNGSLPAARMGAAARAYV